MGPVEVADFGFVNVNDNMLTRTWGDEYRVVREAMDWAEARVARETDPRTTARSPKALLGVLQIKAEVLNHPCNPVAQQETFWPIITLQTFGSETEAFALANDVDLALASSVWTSDHDTAHRCSVDLHVGCVWVNTHIPLVAEMPHGGFKQSGCGKDLPQYGLEDYARIKHVIQAYG